jgi:signal transduction histidine kinase
MKLSTHKIGGRARPGILNAVATALYFLILGLALYELDRQHFTGQKEKIIREHFREIFPLPDNLAELAGDVLFSKSPGEKQAAAAKLQGQMQAIVDGPTSIFSFALEDANREVVMNLYVADPAKPDRLNTWRNCLFFRSFERLTDLGVKRERGAPGAGRLVARYTTPADYPPLHDLTVRYWFIAAGLTALWSLLYFFLFKYILRPMQSVTAYLQQSTAAPPRLIPRPGGGLEAAYNDMATRALLQQLGEVMNDLLRGEAHASRGDTIARALSLVRDAFGIDRISLAVLSGPPESLAVVEAHSQPPGNPMSDAEIAAAARTLVSSPADSGEGQRFWSALDGSFRYVSPFGTGHLYVGGNLDRARPGLRFRVTCARLACDAMRRGLLAHRALQQDIFQQRNEANIVLSKNLGHDLTNIIATSKLDLMAVRQLLGLPPEQLDTMRSELLRQSVEGVLQSTRFLQEIVNVYRSFSYVKRPQYERHQLNEVLEQFLQIFEPTVSTRISIRREMEPGIPPLILEPRLVKLALFNVLTNALDAIRRAQKQDGAPPSITVRTAFDPADSVYRIEIDDNGPGIRDTSGRLLAKVEIETIFQHGYSTKPERSEGLGLNWVRTIVEDFHDGTARAENLPGGGARFTLCLKSMETAEAKIG